MRLILQFTLHYITVLHLGCITYQLGSPVLLLALVASVSSLGKQRSLCCTCPRTFLLGKKEGAGDGMGHKGRNWTWQMGEKPRDRPLAWVAGEL